MRSLFLAPAIASFPMNMQFVFFITSTAPYLLHIIPQFSQLARLLTPTTMDIESVGPIVEEIIYQQTIFIFTYVQILLWSLFVSHVR